MSAELALKLNGTTGEIDRMVSGTDFVPEGTGGTGQTSYAEGDLLQGNALSGLTKLPIGTVGQVLTSSGTAASWQTPVVASELQTLINDEATALIVGNAVYSDASGGVKKAKADAAGTANVVGLSLTATAAAGAATIQTSGVVTLTTGQWDAITGQTGGLVFNSWYFLSAATAGLLTPTPPNTTGQRLVRFGKALSTTKMLIVNDGPYGL